jgi:hypothetical protein
MVELQDEGVHFVSELLAPLTETGLQTEDGLGRRQPFDPAEATAGRPRRGCGLTRALSR